MVRRVESVKARGSLAGRSSRRCAGGGLKASPTPGGTVVTTAAPSQFGPLAAVRASPVSRVREIPGSMGCDHDEGAVVQSKPEPAERIPRVMAMYPENKCLRRKCSLFARRVVLGQSVRGAGEGAVEEQSSRRLLIRHEERIRAITLDDRRLSMEWGAAWCVSGVGVVRAVVGRPEWVRRVVARARRAMW
jgi:hypothetical protein